MNTNFARTAVAALLLVGFAGTANAQTAATDAEHSAHHPAAEAVAPTAPSSPPATAPAADAGMPMQGMMQRPGSGTGMMPGMGSMVGMMGGRSMMEMMHGRAAMDGPMLDHVEGRLAFLRAELGITEEQAGTWNAFADAMRAAGASLRKAREEAGEPGSWPEQLERQAAMLSARIEALRPIREAAPRLYETLSTEQKTKINQLMAGPMGPMWRF